MDIEREKPLRKDEDEKKDILEGLTDEERRKEGCDMPEGHRFCRGQYLRQRVSNAEARSPVCTNLAEDTAMNGLPVTHKATVWHIGDLEPLQPRRTGIGGSHEGPGVAVSECPEDWRQIARLGGGSLWQLSRTDGEYGQFIDFHELTQAQRDDYIATAVRKRLIRRCSMWRVFVGYGEYGEEWMSFATRKEAEWELRNDQESTIEEFDAYEALTEFDTWWQQYFTRSLAECNPATGHGELAILKLMMEEGHHDGVWWYDNYDPLGLSAPRGVIFPTRLDDWDRRCVDDALDPSANYSPTMTP